jgi:hypothetical protein
MKTMRHWATVLTLSILLMPIKTVYAAPIADNNTAASAAVQQPRIIGSEPDSPTVKDLEATYSDLVQASNTHSMEDILKHYSAQFMSGDNLTIAQMRDMIRETWDSYPDIIYNSTPIEIRVYGDWATIETLDHSVATAPPDKNIMPGVPGKMVSDSRSQLFLRKTGNSWEVTSDSTIWEQAIIRYGIGEDLPITLSAPEQVKAGESYSAKLQVKIPDGTFSIATMDNQELTFPHPKVNDKFRALEGENNELQRVLKANTDNRNEIVTATFGVTYIEQKNPEKPSLLLNGIATIVKRVNVVPTTNDEVAKGMENHTLVKTSANGNVSASTKPDSSNVMQMEVVPSEESQPSKQDKDQDTAPGDEEEN